MFTEKEEKEIFRSCKRFLTHHYRKSPAEVLAETARSCGADESADFYGQGELAENFEREVANLLGKECAVFMPSGTMAQPIALRVWAERKRNKNFGLHPTSHLENHEQHAYRHLHGLNGIFLGEKSRVLAPRDLARNSESLASVILELPHRDLGGALPEWADLQEMSAWCRQRGVCFHLDGARLWEVGPYYGKTYLEICSLFDTAYVSFYKGLGGIAGAVLAGPKEFIGEARIWQRRQGGNLISLYPYIVSARAALHLRLPRMRIYFEKALEIGECLRQFPELQLIPSPPQTNMMHLLVRTDLKRLEGAFLRIAMEKKVALFRKIEKLEDGLGRMELTVGDATLDLSAAEIKALFGDALEEAGKG